MIDLIFPAQQVWFELALGILILAAGWCFGFLFYRFVSKSSKTKIEATVSPAVARTVGFCKFLAKILMVLGLFLAPISYLRQLAGVRLGTYEFTGILSQMLFIGGFFLLGSLIYLVFSYLHRKFWYSGFDPT
jgi:hypothetical protein